MKNTLTKHMHALCYHRGGDVCLFVFLLAGFLSYLFVSSFVYCLGKFCPLLTLMKLNADIFCAFYKIM